MHKSFPKKSWYEYMTEMNITKLQFSFSADPLMMLHIPVKFPSISQKLLFSMFKDP